MPGSVTGCFVLGRSTPYLQDHGLELKERGDGLVIANQDGLMVKASSVARELSKGKLVDRFGEFNASGCPVNTEGPGKRYEARPVRSRLDTTLLFARYQNEQQGMRANRTQKWKDARALRDRSVTEVKNKAKLKRAATQLAGGSRAEKKLLYAMTSQSVKRELAKINEHYRQERERIVKQYQPLQWADWLPVIVKISVASMLTSKLLFYPSHHLYFHHFGRD